MLKELGGVWPLLIIKVMIAAPVPKTRRKVPISSATDLSLKDHLFTLL